MIQRLAVILSQEALADLDSIASYILDQSGSERVAVQFATGSSFAARASAMRLAAGDPATG
ncbi:hypothetical protein [Mesorhizobium salmacidum]|uniref:hypothetical protein n=1 Tax=Mesorhizobium salmacidum TaxID=3015171 RepID=UPI00301D327B